MRFFKNVFRSFYDFNLYKEVYHSWNGWAMGYTAGIYAILLGLGLAFGINFVHDGLVAPREGGRPSVIEEATMQMASQWPDSTVEDNVLKSDAPMPHFIAIDVEAFGQRFNETILTIDTSGATNYGNMTTPLLITSTEIIAKESKDGTDETKIRPLSDFFKNIPQPVKLDATKMNAFAAIFNTLLKEHIWKFYLFMGGFFWVFLVPIALLVRICLLIPVAVVGLIMSKCMGRGAGYDAAVRVVAIALIPLTIIEAVTLIAFGSGVSVWIKVLVSVGVFTALLVSEPKVTKA